VSAQDFCSRVIDVFTAIHPLDRVPRAGFLLRGVNEPESVSAHSHALALIALIFCEHYPRYDTARVLGMALVHDLAEARIMDIPMPLADAYLRDAKHEAEQAITEELFAGLSPTFAALNQEFMDGRTAEARLLRALDKAQMMIKVWCYDRERRGRLDEFWENPNNFKDYGVPEVSELFDAICAAAGRARPV